MSIAYTYVIIDDTNGEDVYVGSSRNNNRLYYHERPENRCSSRQIIDNGEYRFEIMETYNGSISDKNLRKKEQQLMNKMRKGKISISRRDYQITKQSKIEISVVDSDGRDVFLGQMCLKDFALVVTGLGSRDVEYLDLEEVEIDGESAQT